LQVIRRPLRLGVSFSPLRRRIGVRRVAKSVLWSCGRFMQAAIAVAHVLIRPVAGGGNCRRAFIVR